jgi:hypothetical protein
VWNGTAWAPGSVGYTPGSPPPGGFLGNVFYQDNAGNFTFEDEFRYTASTNTLAVENITGTTVTGSGVVKGSNTFGQRYATQAATNRAAADTASITVERYFTVTAEGNGESFNIQSDTPSAGNKIVRKIWYKDEAFEDSDVDTWTLLHTFADDATYASTATKWQEYLDGQSNGTPPFTLAISWEDVPAVTGILDDYTADLAGAYSPALLDINYAGSAIRVRRASDNTEQDIGFDGADLDTAALTTFCTGTDCFIRTWYDQSGNTRNLTQTTTANQPKIYDAATGVITGGGNSRPYLSFNGSQWLKVAFGSSVGHPVQTYVNAEHTTSGVSMLVHSGYSQDVFGVRYDANNAVYFYGGSTPQMAGGWVNNNVGNHLLFNQFDGASSLFRVDGVNVATGNSGTGTSDGITLGARHSNSQGLIGYISCFVMYSTNDTTNRAAIETALNDYFNVY